MRRILTRRNFIQGTVGATVAASLIGTEWFEGQAVAAKPSLVTVVRDEKVLNRRFNVNKKILNTMLEDTVIRLTKKRNIKDAWLSLVSPDDTVGLVPTPHLNPTHDELVDAVKNGLIKAGIPGNKIRLAQGGPEMAKACTALIALPGLKAHWLTGIGTVLKIYIMYSGRPNRYHGQNNSKLGEIWNYPFVKGKTKLVLVDALYPLCDKGPQPDPRYKWRYNGLIAGTDPVAIETVCLKIIMGKRRALRGEEWPLSPPPLCIDAADKVYGLGTSRMDKIEIKKYGWKKGILL